MSLVNDMLRDLEKRNEGQSKLPGQENTVKAAHPVATHSEPESKGNAARIALWAIGVSALLLTAWFLWQDQTVADKPNLAKAVPAAPVQNEVAAKPETVVSTVVPVVIPTEPEMLAQKSADTQVTDILWADKPDGGELSIRLSHPSDVQLISQETQSIALALNNTTLGTTAPDIDSPIVKRLDLVRESQRVLIDLLAYQPSHFVFRMQHEPPALIVGVTSAPDFSAEKKPVVASVGSPEAEQVNAPQEMSDQLVEKSSAESMKQLRNGDDLRVNTEQKAIQQPVQPVVKVKKQLTESQKIKKAKALLAKGNTAAAITLLNQQISEQVNNSLKSRQLLASILLNTTDYQKAESLLDESLKLHSDDLFLTKILARTLLAKGDSAASVKLLSGNPPSLSKETEYYELMASAYQQAGQAEQSAAVYYQLLKFDSAQPRWWVGLGYALEQAGRFQDARTAYQNGLQIPAIDSQLKNYARQRSSALAGR